MSRLDKLSFTPIRLDWTKSHVRRQVFYEGGHHIGEIPVNSDGTFDKECETYKIVKELIDEVYTPTPKLVTWGDIKRFKKISLNRFQLDYQASSYLNFIHDYHRHNMNITDLIRKYIKTILNFRKYIKK